MHPNENEPTLKRTNQLQGGFLFASLTNSPWFFPGLLALLVLGFYLPLWRNDFVDWDDPLFITENPALREFNLRFLGWAWTTFHTGNWIPLSWMSLGLDYTLGGLHPLVFHLTNLFLHILNTLLVFFISLDFLRLAEKAFAGSASSTPSNSPPALGKNRGPAFLAAALFGLHPLHVESVAWASERRDVLCAFFYLLSLRCYLRYAAFPSLKGLLASFVFFVLALLSKPMAITLPLVFLLLDAWPLKRLRPPFSKGLLEKIPFFLVALLFGVITVQAQSQAGALNLTQNMPFSFRILHSFYSLFFYLVKMLLPQNLVPFYPLINPLEDIYSTVNSASLLGAILLTFFFLSQWKKRPYLALGWFYYVLTLLPTLGLVQAGIQAEGDRFTYLSSLGLFLPAGVALARLFSLRKELFTFFAILFTSFLGWGTFSQLALWRDSISLWEAVVGAYPDVSQLAQTNLGMSYEKKGRFEEALREYDRALALPPPNPYDEDLKGNLLLRMGRVNEAIPLLKEAVAHPIPGQSVLPFQQLWEAYEQKGMHREAMEVIQEALPLDPRSATSYFFVGINEWELGSYAEAAQSLEKALALDPANSQYLQTLSAIYVKEGKKDLAAQCVERARSLEAQRQH